MFTYLHISRDSSFPSPVGRCAEATAVTLWWPVRKRRRRRRRGSDISQVLRRIKALDIPHTHTHTHTQSNCNYCARRRGRLQSETRDSQRNPWLLVSSPSTLDQRHTGRRGRSWGLQQVSACPSLVHIDALPVICTRFLQGCPYGMLARVCRYSVSVGVRESHSDSCYLSRKNSM